MASANPILALYSTVQTNVAGSTIITGFIPYISTTGKQVYTSTLSSLTVSSLITTPFTYPNNTTNVATTAYVSSAIGSLLTTPNTWTANNTFNGNVYVPNYGNLTDTLTSLFSRTASLETTTMKQGTLYNMTGRVSVNGRNEYIDYYLSDGYIPRGGGGSWYGNQWYYTQ